MEEQLHRAMARRPFQTITVALVVFALILSVVLLARIGYASPSAAATPPPPHSSAWPTQPLRPTAKALLTALHQIGQLQHPSPNQQPVIEEFTDNNPPIEVKTTVTTADAEINLAALTVADVTVRPDGVATVTLSNVTVNLTGTMQQYREPGSSATWADITPNARVPGLDQWTRQEQNQLTTGIRCAAASWVQSIVTQRLASAGFSAVIVQVGPSC
jgi:hypothetical protein